MSREEIITKINNIKGRIFVQEDLNNELEFLYDTKSITLRDWQDQKRIYSYGAPHIYGKTQYKELKKWYEVIGGRYDKVWYGKQLVKSFLSKYVDEKFIVSVDINTKDMLKKENEEFSERYAEHEHPNEDNKSRYCYPYDEENTCKIKITLLSTIDDDSLKKLEDFETQDDLKNDLHKIFVMTKDQISLDIGKRNPEERFQHLLEKRKNKVLTAISSLKKLSNKKNYNITSDISRQKIESSISQINRELMEVKRKFLEKDDKGLFSSQEEVNEKEFKLVFDLQNDSIQALKKTIKDLEKELNIIKGHEKPF